MANVESQFVRVSGHSPVLVDRLREPLAQALESRRTFYWVEIDSIGRVGEVMVRITSNRGRVPLLFDGEELEPGYVLRVVSDTVARFGL